MVPSPKKLLGMAHFPRCYTAQVTLGGAVGAEVKASLLAMKLPPPVFSEILDEKGVIRLSIANKEYPLVTRDLVSGIVNPGQMIDVILSSLLRYHSADDIRQLASETTIKKNVTVLDNRPVFTLFLSPVGTRFAYRWDDMGAFVHESWLTSAMLTIDTSTYVVYEISGRKYSRTFSVDASEKPPLDSADVRYTITYDTASGLLPLSLTVRENKSEKLKIVVTYRPENGATVFNSRSIIYALPNGSKTELSLYYGLYTMSLFGKPDLDNPIQSGYMKKLGGAATLARKATDCLSLGDISAAARVFKRLSQEYPSTPQGIEAARLLQNLPR